LSVTLTAALAGCASVYNLPGNLPLGAALADNNFGREVSNYEDDLLLALSFSGGGTRAAAFSFGVLSEFDRSRRGSGDAKSLLDRVDFVSGVSGGSITAAYFGLKKRAALDDFRERFLLRNAEEGLNTQVSLGNIGRALGGGVNDSQFTSWLDRNLFDGARFDAFREDRRPPGLDQRLRHLQPHALRVRKDYLRRAVQRHPFLSRGRGGGGFGGRAARLCTDRARDLSGRLRDTIAGLA
jgi:NTE family protein